MKKKNQVVILHRSQERFIILTRYRSMVMCCAEEHGDVANEHTHKNTCLETKDTSDRTSTMARLPNFWQAPR